MRQFETLEDAIVWLIKRGAIYSGCSVIVREVKITFPDVLYYGMTPYERRAQ